MSSRPFSVGMFLGRPDRSARLAERLRARGLEVVHYNVPGTESSDVAVSPQLAGALRHILLHTNHDVYWTGLSHVPGLALLLNQLLRRKPYVFNETSLNWKSFADRSRGKPFPRLFENVVHPFLLERTFAGATRIVCNSRFLEKAMSKRYPQFRERLDTIYNGIDFDRFSAGRRRRLPGGGPGNLVLVSTTTLNFGHKSRGIDLILDAFSGIHSAEPAARLVIAAKSSRAKYPQAVTERLAREPWGYAVDFRVNVRDMPELLASGDVFLYATPPGSDSLPRAVLEAQAAGLPVVATATCGCPEIVVHGETGLLVPYDAEAMFRAVQTLAEDAPMRRNMRSSARERVAERFTWDRMADEYARTFLEIAS